MIKNDIIHPRVPGLHLENIYTTIFSALILIIGDLFCFFITKLIFRGPLESQIFFYQQKITGNEYSYTGIDPFWIMMAVCIVLAWLQGHYRKHKLPFEVGRQQFPTMLWLMAMDAVLMISLGKGLHVLWFVALTWVTVFLLTIFVRDLMRLALHAVGLYCDPVVILGTGENARETYRMLTRFRSMGFTPVAFVQPDEETVDAEAKASGLPVYKSTDNLAQTIQDIGAKHVIIAQDAEDLRSLEGVITALAFVASIRVIPPVRGLPLYGMEIEHVFGQELLMLHVRNNLARRHVQLAKRVMDLLGSTILLSLLSPVLLTIALLVRQDGPIFYAHQRVGRNGKPFFCLKFRSMIVNSKQAFDDYMASHPEAREEWERDHKLRDDPRITRLGAFLRRTSLDELPQLINVFLGDMSLVGPRPIVTDEIPRYGENFKYYAAMRPGISGLWQVSGRNDVEYSYRVFLDSWYAKNWSLWYDIIILFKTIAVVLNRAGAY